MLKTITIAALLLAATPAMAQYVPFGQQSPAPFGSPPPVAQPYQVPQIQMQPVQRPITTCTQTCVPLGGGTQSCTTTCN